MLEASGLKAERDFFLAFSPERVDPGNPQFHDAQHSEGRRRPGPASTELASALYSAVVAQVVPVSSTRVAEMVKLLENTFRAVNIGLVNEIALMCHKMDIDVWEVIDAAKTKPFGFMPFYPGPGLGGHCIPVDPFYLSWKARQSGFECRFIELAGQVNASMPEYVVQRVADALNSVTKPINGSRVHLFGVAYKTRRQRRARIAGARRHRAAHHAAARRSAIRIRTCRSWRTARSTARVGAVRAGRRRPWDCAVIYDRPHGLRLQRIAAFRWSSTRATPGWRYRSETIFRL